MCVCMYDMCVCVRAIAHMQKSEDRTAVLGLVSPTMWVLLVHLFVA